MKVSHKQALIEWNKVAVHTATLTQGEFVDQVERLLGRDITEDEFHCLLKDNYICRYLLQITVSRNLDIEFHDDEEDISQIINQALHEYQEGDE